jgi:hypothetical protein
MGLPCGAPPPLKTPLARSANLEKLGPPRGDARTPGTSHLISACVTVSHEAAGIEKLPGSALGVAQNSATAPA